MGCGESREQGIQAELKNFTVIQGAFLSASMEDGGYVLAPINQLEYTWKKSLPESSYGPWKSRSLPLNDELKLEGPEEFADTVMKQLKVWCREHEKTLRRGIQGKSTLVF